MKQETPEEAAERIYPMVSNEYLWHVPIETRKIFIEGTKWQQERSYNEEEVMTMLYCFHYDLVNSNIDTKEEWFKQYKKK